MHRSIHAVGRECWDALFGDSIEAFDYLAAVEASGLEGFEWRYFVVTEAGRVLAAAPAFVTSYALDTTLTGSARHIVAALRERLPRVFTYRLACLGSPCTETLPLALEPSLGSEARVSVLGALVRGVEEAAARESAALVAFKDVPAAGGELLHACLCERGFQLVPGLPVAHLEVNFASLDAYLQRLSTGTRRDMRRKLRAAASVRTEIRTRLGPHLPRVLELYRETRARGDMQFETLTAEYFDGVTARMGGRAFYVLYFVGDALVAANLLVQGRDTLLDKFFCMEAERGREHNLYFLSWFTNVRLCLERGLRRYQSGQAAYENKLRLGSSLARTGMYFRHRNAILDRALRVAAPWLVGEPLAQVAS